MEGARIPLEVSHVKAKVRLFILGFVLGSCAALPLGINFGRGAPLLTNPFTRTDVQDQMVKRMRTGTKIALKGARERLHDATEPLVPPK